MSDGMASELDDLWREAEEHVECCNFDQAIEIYRYILIRYGDSNSAAGYAHACLGEVLLMLGRTDQGENHVRKALSYDPENPSCHFLLGCVYGLRYEWENAIQEYRLALDREPWNPTYLRAIGEAIFNSGDRKLGLEYLQKAMDLCPENSGMLTELATAYLSLGDFASARLYTQRAVAIRPDNILAWVVMKKAYALENGLSHGTTS